MWTTKGSFHGTPVSLFKCQKPLATWWIASWCVRSWLMTSIRHDIHCCVAMPIAQVFFLSVQIWSSVTCRKVCAPDRWTRGLGNHLLSRPRRAAGAARRRGDHIAVWVVHRDGPTCRDNVVAAMMMMTTTRACCYYSWRMRLPPAAAGDGRIVIRIPALGWPSLGTRGSVPLRPTTRRTRRRRAPLDPRPARGSSPPALLDGRQQ